MAAKYPFLRAAPTIFRILGWVALIGGIFASIFIAIYSEQPGLGILFAILGIVVSVACWVSLLTAAELIHLFVDLEQNTRKPPSA